MIVFVCGKADFEQVQRINVKLNCKLERKSGQLIILFYSIFFF